MAGKFFVKRGTTGKYRFNLLSPNGKVIATSEAYETKRACMSGIESVRKNSSKSPNCRRPVEVIESDRPAGAQ